MKIFNTLFLILIAGGFLPTHAQSKVTETSPWTIRLNAGIQSFSTSGIAKSRNQVNFESSSFAANAPTYTQESGIVGLALEAAVLYRIKPAMRLGMMMNAFRDDDEYIGQTDKAMSISQILTDSLHSLSIRNMQSYINLGLNYEYDFILPSHDRHKITLGLASGLTINRTPDRTEYDVFNDRHYVKFPVNGSSDDWYITHTHFYSGWFVMPSIAYGFKVWKNNWIQFSIATSMHRLSSAGQVEILDKVSSGSLDKTPYSLRSIQYKIGYSF